MGFQTAVKRCTRHSEQLERLVIDFSHNTDALSLIIVPCKNIFVRFLNLTGLLLLAGLRFKED